MVSRQNSCASQRASWSSKRQHLSELHAQRNRFNVELDAHQRALINQLRTAYSMGRQDKLKLILNQVDTQVVGRMLVYYDYMHKARRLRIAQVEQDLERLYVLQRQIQQHSTELENLQRNLSTTTERLDQARKRRKQVLATLHEEFEDSSKLLGSLAEDEARLEALLDGITDALADVPSAQPADMQFAGRKGKLPWPVQGPVAAVFGQPRTRHNLSAKWQGVLIQAPEGQAIYTIAGGRIAFADWMRGYGLLTIVDHGDGYMSLYGYGQSLYKTVGEWVEAGELLARVGNSGGQKTSALYFEIRYSGKPLNPVSWCNKRIKLARSVD